MEFCHVQFEIFKCQLSGYTRLSLSIVSNSYNRQVDAVNSVLSNLIKTSIQFNWVKNTVVGIVLNISMQKISSFLHFSSFQLVHFRTSNNSKFDDMRIEYKIGHMRNFTQRSIARSFYQQFDTHKLNSSCILCVQYVCGVEFQLIRKSVYKSTGKCKQTGGITKKRTKGRKKERKTNLLKSRLDITFSTVASSHIRS